MTIDEIMAQINAEQEAALKVVGEAYEDQLKTMIGVQNPPPLYLESSVPGQPPKRRTGALQEGIGSLVHNFGDDHVVLFVTSSREGDDPDVPAILEKMDRPFMSLSFKNAQENTLGLVAEIINAG